MSRQWMPTKTHTGGNDMTTRSRWQQYLLVAMVALVGVAAAPVWVASEAHAIDFGKAKIRIEYNSSDEDVGVQVFLDGDPWKTVKAVDPNGRTILEIDARTSLGKQGLTELFFESSEPSLAEVPLEKFLDRFPEGIYEFTGQTIDGVTVTGEAVLTHVIPAGAEIVSPVSSTAEPPVVDTRAGVLIDWKPVTTTISGSTDITIVRYQVIVEQVRPLRVFSIELPADITRVRVPAGFFVQRDTLHKFEVLAIEAGGNQTITEGEFVTEP